MWRTIPSLLVWASLMAGSCPLLNATPLKDPRRLINGQTADLTPLFKWWVKREGSRPLSAWLHVTGTIVQTNAYGWVVEARIEPAGHRAKSADAPPEGQHRIVLHDPPLQDLAEFEQLHDQMSGLTEQHSALAGQQTQAKQQADAISREQRSLRRYGEHSPTLAVAAGDLHLAQKQTNQQLQPVNQQMKDLTKKLAAFPNADHYEVDCFALKTGRSYQGMPVFDHGQVYH